MEKEFNLNVGDTVWFMYQDSVVTGQISKIKYAKHKSCVTFETISDNESYYVTVNGREIGDYNLKSLFHTKEELLKSL